MSDMFMTLEVMSPGDFVRTMQAAFYPMRLGWYFRPSQATYEFWWQGTEPKLTVTAEALSSVLPPFIEREVKDAVFAKGQDGVIDG